MSFRSEVHSYGEFLALRAAENRNSETPFLDASLILAHCLGISRDRLLAALSESNTTIPLEFEQAWARRLAGESVASIIGKKEFYGREFFVDRRVLIPRPDTETLVSAALELGDKRLARIMESRTAEVMEDTFSVIDVCTGSGAIAITLAAERPAWKICGSDISDDALYVARHNSLRILGKELTYFRSDLLADLDVGSGIISPGVENHAQSRFDLIVANPPYVSSAETAGLMAKGWAEPALALDGGPDGLDIVQRLIVQAPGRLKPGGFLLIETDALQCDQVRDMFEKEGFRDIKIWKDLAGLPRVTSGILA